MPLCSCSEVQCANPKIFLRIASIFAMWTWTRLKNIYPDQLNLQFTERAKMLNNLIGWKNRFNLNKWICETILNNHVKFTISQWTTKLKLTESSFILFYTNLKYLSGAHYSCPPPSSYRLFSYFICKGYRCRRRILDYSGLNMKN